MAQAAVPSSDGAEDSSTCENLSHHLRVFAHRKALTPVPPWLGGGEMVAEFSRDQKDRNASKIAHGPRHPTAPTQDLVMRGQPWLSGQIMPARPTWSLSETFL